VQKRDSCGATDGIGYPITPSAWRQRNREAERLRHLIAHKHLYQHAASPACGAANVGPCKCDASPHPGCVKNDDPSPARGICRLNDFKLNTFIFHRRTSIRDHGHCCSDGNSPSILDLQKCRSSIQFDREEKIATFSQRYVENR
jgi:hypothetical protein